MSTLNLRSVRTNLENEYGKFKIFTPWANVEHRYYIEFYPPKVDVLDESPERCLGIMTIYNPETEKISIKMKTFTAFLLRQSVLWMKIKLPMSTANIYKNY